MRDAFYSESGVCLRKASLWRPKKLLMACRNSSTMAYEQGIMMRVRTVETVNPKMMEMAIGERNLAWPEAKKPRGVKPAAVVMVVKRMGRRRS